MAKGAKTLLQSQEPKLGIHAQPTAPMPLLGLGAPKTVAKPMDISFLSTELPGSTPSPKCCSLKRTFACTNLLLLSQDEPDGATDEASPGPCLHNPCPKDNAEPAVPPSRRGLTPPKKTIQDMESVPVGVSIAAASPGPLKKTASTLHRVSRTMQLS